MELTTFLYILVPSVVAIALYVLFSDTNFERQQRQFAQMRQQQLAQWNLFPVESFVPPVQRSQVADLLVILLLIFVIVFLGSAILFAS